MPEKSVREISALEYAKLKDLSLTYVYIRLRLGKIPGARMVDGQWRIQVIEAEK